MMRYFLQIVLVLVVLQACDQARVYQDFKDFDEGFWHQDSVVSFDFTIEDASKVYNLRSLFRHSQSYPYHNMYYQYQLKNTSDSVLSEQLMQVYFFDAKTGDPLGSGIGDLFDVDQPVMQAFKFPEAGKYSVNLKQYMRLDTLPFVLSAGWRVELAEEE